MTGRDHRIRLNTVAVRHQRIDESIIADYFFFLSRLPTVQCLLLLI